MPQPTEALCSQFRYLQAALRLRLHGAKKEDLRERLSKYEDPQPPKNSTNSSVPPSKERIGDEIKRRTTSVREKKRQEARRSTRARWHHQSTIRHTR